MWSWQGDKNPRGAERPGAGASPGRSRAWRRSSSSSARTEGIGKHHPAHAGVTLQHASLPSSPLSYSLLLPHLPTLFPKQWLLLHWTGAQSPANRAGRSPWLVELGPGSWSQGEMVATRGAPKCEEPSSSPPQGGQVNPAPLCSKTERQTQTYFVYKLKTESNGASTWGF